MTYSEWRNQLHELQQQFDEFEENWDYTRPHEEYQAARQPWVDRIEAHYRLEAQTI